MGMTIDDDIKQKLLDILAEEPTMVLSMAYVYAKNYVEYGEDVTKAWTTVVQQTSIIQKVRQKAQVEAYDSFKKDYETRLKVDMVSMLTELQLEIEEIEKPLCHSATNAKGCVDRGRIEGLIQQKINALKTEIESQENK